MCAQTNKSANLIACSDIVYSLRPRICIYEDWHRDCVACVFFVKWGPLEFRFFEIYRNADYVMLLIDGAVTSVFLAAGGGVIGFILASVLAGLQWGRVPVLHMISSAYVEFVRNTPLIVQLFFVAFGLPLLLGYQWPFWGHALLALTLNFSAYFTAILMGGFRAISGGQLEAARALGLSQFQAFRKVLFPQVAANMYPSLNGQFVFLFLTTGVIAEIGVSDLTQAGLFIDSRTFRTFEVFFTLTVIYIAIALSFKMILHKAHGYIFPWWGAR